MIQVTCDASHPMLPYGIYQIRSLPSLTISMDHKLLFPLYQSYKQINQPESLNKL